MKVHKIVAYFIDHEDYGPDEYKNAVEWNASGTVLSVESADIGEWDDDHPLNMNDTAAAEMERLFPPK